MSTQLFGETDDNLHDHAWRDPDLHPDGQLKPTAQQDTPNRCERTWHSLAKKLRLQNFKFHLASLNWNAAFWSMTKIRSLNLYPVAFRLMAFESTSF